jgi:hypothetical protein
MLHLLFQSRATLVITGYYALDSLTNLPSDIRGVGLQVGPVNTGYYAMDSLTYVPSANPVMMGSEASIVWRSVSQSDANYPVMTGSDL